MPLRNAFQHRRQQIIDGALDAFARLGFDRATNRDIAQAAGIGSPGLIYHYFKDKTDLLYQVIRERMPLLPLIDAIEQLDDEPPDIALPQLGVRLAQALDQPFTVAIGKIVISEVLRHPELTVVINEIGPGRALNALAAYLKRQMELGRLRRIDPQVAARMLVGPMVSYLLSRNVLNQPEASAIAASDMVAETIALFLRGMMPEPGDQ